MTDTSADRLVNQYMKDLDSHLSPLPRRTRLEVVDEIATDIAERRAGLDNETSNETSSEVLNILDRLGPPEVIAAEACNRFRTAPRGAGILEVTVLLGTLFLGYITTSLGIIFPSGLALGAILVSFSRRWRVVHKIVGSYVPLLARWACTQLAIPTSHCWPGCTCSRSSAVICLAVALWLTRNQ